MLKLRPRDIRNMKNTITRRLDFSKLTFSDKEISTKEALKDVEPFNFNKEKLEGNRKI